MNRKLIFLPLVLMYSNVTASDIWVNDTWRDDFVKGLWEGCITKTINAVGYEAESGKLTGSELRDSKDPLLVEIKQACNCQTLYFQDNYSSEELKSILKLDPSSEKYEALMEGVFSKCM